MPKPLVAIKDVSLFIPGLRERDLVLKNISLDILPGRHCALLGPNGSGKSSLLKLIHGDLWPARGQISWLCQGKLDDSRLSGREITGLVSPELQAALQAHPSHITGLDMLAEAAESASSADRLKRGETSLGRVRGLMERLNGMNLLSMRISEMSQGQLRLCLLGREFLREPALLLLDEWSEGLDAVHQNLVNALLADLAAKITLVVSGHQKSSLPDWIQEIHYIEKGRLIPMPDQLPPKKSPGAKPPDPPADAKLIFNLKKVSVFIERQKILDNINWQMAEGECWLISGANGAGKSTFLRLIAGDEFAYAGGEISQWSPKLGKYVETLAEKRQTTSLVSDLGQALYAYDLTALELVLSGFENSVGIYREYSESEIKQAKELLRAFFGDEANELTTRKISRLSTGQLRRLFLARALLTKPDVLLLDEPFSGLDQASRAAFLSLLDKLARGQIADFRPGIILVSHQLEDIPSFINRRARMEQGRLITETCAP